MKLLRLACVPLALLTFACSDEDPPAEKNPWSQPLSELGGALINVTGTSSTDVWLVGGDPGDGKGAMLLHYDGAEFRRIPSSAPDLWWAHAFAGGPVFFGGAKGTILRWESGALSKMTTPPTQGIVFGLWGSAPNDMWAVGGDAFGGQAFVWRYDGTDWTPAAGLPATTVSQFYKVWGTSKDDVRIVGADGYALRYDGSALHELSTPTKLRLLTVHTNDAGSWAAVGGGSKGVIIEDTGSGYVDVTPTEAPKPLFGVRLSGQDGYAVGTNGTILRRAAAGWREERHGIDVFDDFHAVWIDEQGGVWAVGGAVIAPPLVDGMLLYKGKRALPGVVVE